METHTPSHSLPLKPNTKLADLPKGSAANYKAQEFSEAYSKLLNGLHRAFNGDPKSIETTLSLMYDVKLIGETLAAMPFPNQPEYNVGPTFEYVKID